MDIDYNKLDGRKIEDPIGKTMLQNLWENKFREHVSKYKTFDTLFEFMQTSIQLYKINSFGFNCYKNKDDDTYRIDVIVLDFNNFKNKISILVDKKDFEKSAIGQIELYKEELDQKISQKERREIEEQVKELYV